MSNTQKPEAELAFSILSECSICFCTIEEEEETKLKGCQHSFCKDCLQEYLKTEINSFNVLRIKCPEQNCFCTLNFSNLEELLESSDFEKYQRLLLQKITKRTEDIICPQPGCSRIILAAKDSTSTKCGCGSIICNLCGSLDHPNKTCIAAVDPEFEAFAAENNLKMCLMCKTMIARVEGCLHMTCSICDYDWCWVCGREYAELHDSKCPKIWSPLPPRRILKEDSSERSWEKLQMIFCKIFSLIMLQLFFPYAIFNVHLEFREPTRPRRDNILLFSLLTLVQLIYFGSFGAFVYLIAIYPDDTTPFVFGIILIGTTPWITKIIISIISKKSQNNKRWMSRNAKTFHYTPANQPAKDLENSSRNARTQLNQETENEVEIQEPDVFDRQNLIENEVLPLKT